MNEKPTKEELDYFLTKIDFGNSFLDAKAIEIMNRLDLLTAPAHEFTKDELKVEAETLFKEHGIDEHDWGNFLVGFMMGVKFGKE